MVWFIFVVVLLCSFHVRLTDYSDRSFILWHPLDYFPPVCSVFTIRFYFVLSHDKAYKLCLLCSIYLIIFMILLF